MIFWLLMYYRKFLVSGIILTPMLVSLIVFSVQVAPPMMLAHNYGFYESVYPAGVFFAAMSFLWFGYLLVGRKRLRISPEMSGVYYRFLNKQGEARGFISRVSLIGLLVVLGLIFYRGLPDTYHSLMSILRGNFGDLLRDVQQSRLDLTKGAYFGGEWRGQGIMTTIQEVGWSLLIAHASTVLALRGGLRSYVWLIFIVLGAWLFVAGTGTRAPFALTLVAGLVAYSLVRPVSVRGALIFFFILILALIAQTMYTHRFEDILTGDASWYEAFERIFDRLMYGNGANDVLAMEAKAMGLFTEPVGHWHLRNFVAAIPGVQGGPPMAFRLTELFGGGATTFRSGTYLSTIYVDFGLIGIPIVFAMIGATFRLFENSTLPPSPHPWSIAIIATTTLLTTKLITGGFQALLSNMVILAALLVFHAVVLVLMSVLPGRGFDPGVRAAISGRGVVK